MKVEVTKLKVDKDDMSLWTGEGRKTASGVTKAEGG